MHSIMEGSNQSRYEGIAPHNIIFTEQEMMALCETSHTFEIYGMDVGIFNDLPALIQERILVDFLEYLE